MDGQWQAGFPLRQRIVGAPSLQVHLNQKTQILTTFNHTRHTGNAIRQLTGNEHIIDLSHVQLVHQQAPAAYHVIHLKGDTVYVSVDEILSLNDLVDWLDQMKPDQSLAGFSLPDILRRLTSTTPEKKQDAMSYSVRAYPE